MHVNIDPYADGPTQFDCICPQISSVIHSDGQFTPLTHLSKSEGEENFSVAQGAEKTKDMGLTLSKDIL